MSRRVKTSIPEVRVMPDESLQPMLLAEEWGLGPGVGRKRGRILIRQKALQTTFDQAEKGVFRLFSDCLESQWLDDRRRDVSDPTPPVFEIRKKVPPCLHPS